MTLAQLINVAALVLACAIAFWRGREPERLGVSIVAIGFIVTPLVERRENWLQPQYGILAVDVMILAALVVMAFRYDRYWTVCAAAFQTVAVLTHFAFLIRPGALYRAYYFANFAIGFLILGTVVGGVLIERGAPYRRRRPLSPGPPSTP